MVWLWGESGEVVFLQLVAVYDSPRNMHGGKRGLSVFTFDFCIPKGAEYVGKRLKRAFGFRLLKILAKYASLCYNTDVR